MSSRFQLPCLRRFSDSSQVRRVAWSGQTTLLFHLSRKYGRVLGRRKCVTNAVSQKSAEKRAVQVPQKNVWAIDCRINSLSGMSARLRPLMPANPMDRYANTSAGTVPIMLDETYRMGKLKKGDIVVSVAIGAGWAWGATVYRWTKEQYKGAQTAA